MVTASDGSPSRVTSQPFTAPATAPASRTTGMISSIAQPASHSAPSSALARPSTEATDRSISAATITNVSGRAMIAISTTSDVSELKLLPVRKSDVVTVP
jgi:hypothetical protein